MTTSQNQASPVLSAAERHAIQNALTDCGHLPGALLPVLHAIQDALGHVPTAAVPLIASELNLSRADVHGVVSFYHHFRNSPPGQHTVQICRAEACQAVGARLLEHHVKQRLAIDFHQTTADGRVSLEPVYCLGNCACAPSMLISGELHGRMTPERFDEWLATLKQVSP